MKTLLKKAKQYFEDWTMFEKVWLGAFTIVNIYLYFVWKDTLIGLTTSLTGMLCVVLTAKGRISNYYPGIINVILYAIISYEQKYYGEVILNILYFLPMQFIGLYMWNRNKEEDTEDKVLIKFMTNKQRILWAVITVVAVYITVIGLETIRTELPFMGAMSSVVSVIAMVLLAKRYMEQWVLWIFVDAITIIMWFIAFKNGGNDVSMLVMWTAYLVNAIYGVSNWIRIYYRQKGGMIL